MNIQISPISLTLVTPFYALCLFVLYRLWRKLKASPWRWSLPPLIPVLALLPFADEFWIAWHFEQACKEAGVHVYRQVEVEGFFDETGGPSSDHVDKFGFRFTEGVILGRKGVAHEEKINDKWQRTILEHPQARYYYRRAHQQNWVPAGFQVGRSEYQIIDSKSGEIIGRDIKYERFPGVVEGLWVRFLGSGQTICEGTAPKPPELRHLLYHYVLIPKKLN